MKVCYALQNWLCLKMLKDIRFSLILTKCSEVRNDLNALQIDYMRSNLPIRH